MAERRLSLHVSALSDAEYEFYTTCFQDLVADGDKPATQDNITDGSVGIREARAWIRGRFPNVQTGDVDTILKYFSPNLAHVDTIDAGQFFAALRLVIHADEGNDIERGLAFVQAHPPGKPRSRSTSPNKAPVNRVISQSGVPSASKRAQPPVPPPLSRSHSQTRARTTSSNNNNPFLPSTNNTPALPPLPPRKPQPPPPPHRTTPHVTTPLMRQSLQASKVGSALKQAEKLLEKERVMQVLKSSAPSPSPPATNRRSTSPTKPHPGIPPSSSSSSSEKGREAPPLPRRSTLHLTPSHSPPLSTSSWEHVASATVPTPATPQKRPPPPPSKSSKPKPPPLPPKPSPDRLTVELPPPTHPDRRRPSISSSSPSYHSPSQQSHTHSRSVDSPASENMSFEAVYGADFQVPPPARVGRSKSLHASPTQSHGSIRSHHSTTSTPSSKAPPALPLSAGRVSHRKRPDSASMMGIPARQLSLLARVGNGDMHREGESGESHIAKTLDKLTKARYKAEAGLSRRGFLPDSHDSLVHRDDTDDSMRSGPYGDRSGDDGGGGRGRAGKEGRVREEYNQLEESALDSDSSIDDEDLRRRRIVQNRLDGWMGPL